MDKNVLPVKMKNKLIENLVNLNKTTMPVLLFCRVAFPSWAD